MLKAVAFDLWETLITNTPDASREQKRLRVTGMERLLRNHNLEQIVRAHDASWDRLQDLYWSRDVDISCRVQVEHFLELLGVDPLDEETLAALEDAYANAILDHLPDVVAGAHDMLREMRDRGLRIGFLSDTRRPPGTVLGAG